MRRLPMMLSVIALIVLSAYVPPVAAQGGTPPTLKAEINVPNSANDKWPSIVATGQTVHFTGGVSLTGSSDNTNAFYWNIAEQATSIGAGFNLGPSKGKPDYSPVSVGAAPDGTVYAIWSSIDDRTVTLRRRDTAGAWGPARLIASGGFSVYPEVAATNTQVYVMWQEPGSPLFMKTSSDLGATWSGAFSTPQKTYTRQSKFALGPSGQVAISYPTINLEIAVSFWDGSSLSNTELLTASKAGSDPTISYDSSGKLYAAWRGLGSSGTGSGVYYAERQGANSWAVTQLIPGSVRFGSVNVLVDGGGSVHLGWGAEVSSGRKFFYSVRKAGQSAFTTPVSSNSTNIFDPRLALSSDGAFVHAVYENFSGGPNFMTYARFASGISTVSATPNFSGSVIRGTSTVPVSFTDVNGSPTQIRWRWGAAPTDATNDSNSWQTFSSPMNISVPQAVLDAATCSPVTLFTQVRNATSAGSAQTDNVTIDAGVTAAVSMTNPHMLRKSAQFTSLGDLGSDGGSSDGAIAYTRDPLVYVGLQGLSECSGIQDVATARSATTVAPAQTVTKDSFANVLPIPGAFSQGNNTVMLRISDKVGNIQDITQTFVYDTTPPVLDTSAAGLTVTSNPAATLIASLKLDTVNVTDNLYPGRGFWGVWVANSRTQIANPLADNSLIWLPVEAPGSSTSFTIQNWGLGSGLTSDKITPGDYYVYVRALDGAGNPSAGFLSAKVTLTKVTRSAVYLPMTVR